MIPSGWSITDHHTLADLRARLEEIGMQLDALHRAAQRLDASQHRHVRNAKKTVVQAGLQLLVLDVYRRTTLASHTLAAMLDQLIDLQASATVDDDA